MARPQLRRNEEHAQLYVAYCDRACRRHRSGDLLNSQITPEQIIVARRVVGA